MPAHFFLSNLQRQVVHTLIRRHTTRRPTGTTRFAYTSILLKFDQIDKKSLYILKGGKFN